MKWNKITLDNQQVIQGVHHRVMNQFEQIFTALKAPQEMALFGRSEAGKDMELFFTPGSMQYAFGLVEEYSGIECDKPAKDDISLLVGHEDSFELLK